MYLGVDTGGTFTDFVLVQTASADSGAALQLQTHKVLSTPAAPEEAILQGIHEMGLDAALRAGQLRIIHGSTVATNAALEGKGVRTAFVTNQGFGDLLSIGRQNRPMLFALETPPVTPPVPAELCLEVDGRVCADGAEEAPLTDASLDALCEAIERLAPEGVVVTLLFSFRNPAHEQTVAERLRTHWAGRETQPFLSLSSEVLAEYQEYERGMATWLNASLGPLMQGYLLRLQTLTAPCPLSIMQSNGGTMAAGQAAQRAVNLLLSGPAGGLAAVRTLGHQCEEPRLMTFDMGGTSTDVALIDQKIGLTSEGRIGPYPVAVPMVDMHTIGAGGGSLAWIDEGGALQVGPASAGADPGPACYGRGGRQATVTDANLILGRLPHTLRLAGSLRPDIGAARQALSALGQPLGLSAEAAAEGILRVANEHMARALRVISVERGHDPRQFHLCSFGGAGGLHICALAEALGMDQAIVPANGGVLSALGMLVAPAERHLSRTFRSPLDTLPLKTFQQVVTQLCDSGEAQLRKELPAEQPLQHHINVDLRYVGQSATLSLPWSDINTLNADFHRLHAQRYGHQLNRAIEIINIRVVVSSNGQLETLPPWHPSKMECHASDTVTRIHGIDSPVPVLDRVTLASGQTLSGPVVVSEVTATTFIETGWKAWVDPLGNLRLTRCSRQKD